TSRLMFSNRAVVTPENGVPTLMFRIGNERSNTIFEASIRVAVVRTERTKEGGTFYRLYDLALRRDRSPALQRSWTVQHRLDDGRLVLDVTKFHDVAPSEPTDTFPYPRR